MASALARIEDQTTVRPLDGPPVRVAVEDDVREVACFEITGIVNHDDASIRPKELERRVGEHDPEAFPGGLERGALARVVVSEDRMKRGLEAREHLERLWLGNVASVDDALDAGRVQELHHAGDVREVVVGIADDADAHSPSRAGAA
jgi:hypothetical protein